MKKFLAVLFLLPTLLLAAQVTLEWENPTHNEDATPLADLAAIRIYENGAFLVEVPTTEPGVTVELGIGERGDGVWVYTATAVDASGNESAPSSPAQTTIDETAPGSPVNVTVIITINQ